MQTEVEIMNPYASILYSTPSPSHPITISTPHHLNTSPSQHLTISTPHHLNTSPSQHT
ncbi:hypothetical protein [Leyella stercorea]|uniref:hypothetical protein n=1 Tax=Leyella stercorea TaxID=363265 RepID=UPI00242D5684|nr:hypothetical protein [Leyella stercorea]